MMESDVSVKKSGYHTKKEEDAAYLYWIHNMQMFTEKMIRFLLEQYGDAKTLYGISRSELSEKLLQIGYKDKVLCKKLDEYQAAKLSFDVFSRYDALKAQKIHFVSCFDPEYPSRLLSLSAPPLMLYYKGELPKEQIPSLAIIGARDCSSYGQFLADSFGGSAGKCGIQVISGMARGIDGIAQNAAFTNGGKTYAVLGCGVDICYPASHQRLYDNICETGAVISPFLPGTTPKRQLFPYRNQIVAGLSDAVLVIEARQHSGTSITVDMALEQGKEIYAVPGRLTDRLSDGCNTLLRQGAGIALSPDDLMAEIRLLKNRKGNLAAVTKLRKTRMEQQDCKAVSSVSIPKEGILRFLDFYPISINELLEKINAAGMEYTIPQLMFELLQYCLTGEVAQEAGSYFFLTGK